MLQDILMFKIVAARVLEIKGSLHSRAFSGLESGKTAEFTADEFSGLRCRNYCIHSLDVTSVPGIAPVTGMQR